MRLWHQQLLEKLPNNQLKGQHRECCALRGNGWKVKHSTVNYIFDYHWYILFLYHMKVVEEINKRNEKGLMNYKVKSFWYNPLYRGKLCNYRCKFFEDEIENIIQNYLDHPQYHLFGTYYKEHNSDYEKECIENLRKKGVEI